MAKCRKATGSTPSARESDEETCLPEVRASQEISRPEGLVDLLASVPADEVWLKSLKSEQTRRAYRNDVRDFVRTLGIGDRYELYRVGPSALLFWCEKLSNRGHKNATKRRKLSALSSLFKHLITEAPKSVSPEERAKLPIYNPVRDVPRPAVNRKQGSTNILSQEETRAVLDAPPADTLLGKRDRLILSIGFQTGARRSEIAALTVGGVHQHNGYTCLRTTIKGDKEHRIPLHPETVARLEEYLNSAGHRGDAEGPLIRPTRKNQVAGTDDMRRHLSPDQVYQTFRRWARAALGVEIAKNFSPHSMRGTFITRAHENGCPRDRIQHDVGHAHASTTDLYIHAKLDLERSASFYASY